MILKVLFANSLDPDQTAPHCLPVCKNRFEKFARIFSRRHKQTTFSDAGFCGVLRVSCCVLLSHQRSLIYARTIVDNELKCQNTVFVCVEVLWPSQPNWVMSSMVSLNEHVK